MLRPSAHNCFVFALLASVVPVLVVHLAYALNVLLAGMDYCLPYWDGCTSVSRAVRSGPGLWLFKAMAVPTALAMALTWRCLPAPPGSAAIRWLGGSGAVFMLVYALALGTGGEFYSWMRRFGVVLYFGFTGLAQLLVGASLARRGAVRPGWAVRLYWVVLSLTWCAGIMSAFKRRLFDDPAMVDRLQNALEWWFALGLALGFFALALLMYTQRRPRAPENPRRSG